MEVEFEVRPARDRDDDPWSARLEMIIAVLLGIAAITAAFAAFRAEQLTSDSNRALYLGQFAETKFVAHNNSRSAQQIVDQNQFLTWYAAWSAADYARASQIRTLMSPNLGTAVDKFATQPAQAQLPYTGPDEVLRQSPSDASGGVSPAPASPLATKAYLAGVGDVKGDRALLLATKEYSAEGLRLSDRSDEYARVAIIIAISLFLYGIAAVSRHRNVKVTAVLLGVVVYGTALIALVLA